MCLFTRKITLLTLSGNLYSFSFFATRLPVFVMIKLCDEATRITSGAWGRMIRQVGTVLNSFTLYYFEFLLTRQIPLLRTKIGSKFGISFL